MGIPVMQQIKEIREQIMHILQDAKEQLKNHPVLSLPSSQDPLASVPIIEHEELPDMSEDEDEDEDEDSFVAAAATAAQSNNDNN